MNFIEKKKKYSLQILHFLKKLILILVFYYQQIFFIIKIAYKNIIFLKKGHKAFLIEKKNQLRLSKQNSNNNINNNINNNFNNINNNNIKKEIIDYIILLYVNEKEIKRISDYNLPEKSDFKN